LLHYAPETPEDALAGDETAIYIPIAVWDNCYDPDLPPLVPGDPQACVLSLDAAVSGDNFGAVVVSRHPDHPDADGRACKRTKAQPAIRAARVWAPDPVTGVIDFPAVEAWIRMVCMGGCMEGHPNKSQTILSAPPDGEECAACAEGRRQAGMNVVQICYDEFQMFDMATRLTHDGIAWVDKFPQTTERLVADGQMHKLAMKGELAHNGDPDLRDHIGNAKAKLQADEESRMRIVKRAPDRKVDLAVAASMGVKRALDLNIE
jgi:phage terminase large subunit-like protein